MTGNCILRSPRVAGDVAAGACAACDKVVSLGWIQLQHPDATTANYPVEVNWTGCGLQYGPGLCSISNDW